MNISRVEDIGSLLKGSKHLGVEYSNEVDVQAIEEEEDKKEDDTTAENANPLLQSGKLDFHL